MLFPTPPTAVELLARLLGQCLMGLAGALVCMSFEGPDVKSPGEEPGLGGFKGCR